MPRGGFNIGVVGEELVGQEDRRWLGTRSGWDQCRSITLDVSEFLAAHVADKGAVPSGTVLAKITATGKYGPYTPNVTTKVQTLTRSATSGTAKLEANNEQTAALTTSAAAFIKANIDAALLSLPGIEIGDFTSVQTSATVLTITGNIPDISVVDVDMAGGSVTAAVTVEQAAAAPATPGLEVAAGFLFTTTKIHQPELGETLATAADVGTALYWGPGIIKQSFLPAFAGTTLGELDAVAKAQLGNFIRWEA